MGKYVINLTTGKVEIQRNQFADDEILYFGSGRDDTISYQSAEGVLTIGLNSDNSEQALVICQQGDEGTAWGLTTTADPHIVLQSSDATSPLERIYMGWHTPDGSGRIKTDAGNITFSPATGILLFQENNIDFRLNDNAGIGAPLMRFQYLGADYGQIRYFGTDAAFKIDAIEASTELWLMQQSIVRMTLDTSGDVLVSPANKMEVVDAELTISGTKVFGGEGWINLVQDSVTDADNNQTVGIVGYGSSVADTSARGVAFTGHTEVTTSAAFGLFGRADDDGISDVAITIFDARITPVSGDWDAGTGTTVSNRTLFAIQNNTSRRLGVFPDGTTFTLRDGSNTIHRLENTVGEQTVFNEQGDDIDTRIETVNFPNAFLVDAGTDTVSTDVLLKTQKGRVVNTTRVTASPYTVLATDHAIFVDTDGGAITVNLPAGVDGTTYRIINTGSSTNDVTIAPNGAELLMGVNANFILLDAEALIITYETTEGWF